MEIELEDKDSDRIYAWTSIFNNSLEKSNFGPRSLILVQKTSNYWTSMPPISQKNPPIGSQWLQSVQTIPPIGPQCLQSVIRIPPIGPQSILVTLNPGSTGNQ